MALSGATNFPNKFANLAYRLNRTNLVICEHHGNQNCVRAKGTTYILQSNDSIFIYRKSRYLPTASLKLVTYTADGRVFNLGRDDVPSMRLKVFCNSTNCKIIRLGTTGKKNYFVGSRTYQRGDLSTSLFDNGPGLLAEKMYAGRIAKFFAKKWNHCFNDPRVGGGSSAVIQIDST